MAAEVKLLARAKINLALHVTGQRADGYHLLDSLVAFADVGDGIAVQPDRALSLRIDGPFAPGLEPGPGNLVWRAAEAMGGAARIVLTKRLPLASGIGGGSADAAATLRALKQLGRSLPSEAAVLALGADVPVCLAGRPMRMRGIGERLDPVDLPPAHLVLVNPGVGVSTPAVFKALAVKENAPLPEMGSLADAEDLAAWLARSTRNDLEAPARGLCPEVAEVLAALGATDSCLLARMSGSGATCFGLYARAEDAAVAARALARPGWWVEAAALV